MNFDFSQFDLKMMNHCLFLAKIAANNQEVPVGSAVCYNNQIIGESFNQTIKLTNPTAHAEMLAIQSACNKIGNYRLLQATIYSTLEPCTMCLGAIINSRIKRLVFATLEPKTGNLISNQNNIKLIKQAKIKVEYGLLENESAILLKNFFKTKRN